MSAANIIGKSKKELYDIMCEMKKLMEQNEEQARQILIENPTLARDLFHAQIMLGMVQPTLPSPSHDLGFYVGVLSDDPEEPSESGNHGVDAAENDGNGGVDKEPRHERGEAPIPAYHDGVIKRVSKLHFRERRREVGEVVAEAEHGHHVESEPPENILEIQDRFLKIDNKIAELAEVHPGLMTFKTTDLSPASWISVAWYPIYQIPTKGNHKDRLSTCFLTYHALSSSSIRGGVKLDKDGDKKGKLDDEIWINGNTFDDYERIIDLYNAAKCWLKRLNNESMFFITCRPNLSNTLQTLVELMWECGINCIVVAHPLKRGLDFFIKHQQVATMESGLFSYQAALKSRP
nr:uncharacterized protein LOC109167854 [Ipomoea batatas]